LPLSIFIQHPSSGEICQITTPKLDDDDNIRARRRALAERELALRAAEIDSLLKSRSEPRHASRT
jgi:hypothetical protein